MTHLLRKNILLLIWHYEYTKHQIPCTFKNQCQSAFTDFWSVTTVISQHTISDPPTHCIGYTTFYAPSVMFGQTHCHAMMIQLSHTRLLVSSHWRQDMVPSQEPLTLQQLYMAFLTASSPLKSVAASSFHAYRIVCGFLSGYGSPLTHPTPASPISYSQDHPWPSAPQHWQPTFSFIGSATVRLSLAINSHRQLLLRHCTAIFESHMEVTCYHLLVEPAWHLLTSFHYLCFHHHRCWLMSTTV